MFKSVLDKVVDGVGYREQLTSGLHLHVWAHTDQRQLLWDSGYDLVKVLLYSF